MASVDTGASGNLWLFPEGDLLVGKCPVWGVLAALAAGASVPVLCQRARDPCTPPCAGTGARATIVETCPTIGAAASVSGRLGQDWTGRLSGSAAVKAVLTHSSQGLYAGSYFTPRVGPYHLDLTRGLRGG